MKQKSKQLGLTLSLLFFTVFAFAQQRTVTGKVITEGGEPLPNISYTVKGTQAGGITDDNGQFSVQLGSNAVLVFSSVNHLTKEVPVGESNELTIVLQAKAGNLQEVVITALGIKRQKESLGYAVQQVSGSTLTEANETNLTNTLSGKVAGLQVVRSSNGAGGSSKLVLRGFTSLTGSNQPLIIVDGIPIDNFTGTDQVDLWSAGLDMGNGLGDINADDIASINVLKGPSAAALYGSRAGNGVILITTKTGRKTQGIGLTLNATLGMEDIFLKPEIQSNFGQGNDGIIVATSNDSWGPKIEGQSYTKWDGTQAQMQAYDNVNAFLRKGTTQDYGLSLQQQYGKTAVYASLGYLRDKSIIPGNKFQRTNLTSRVTSTFGNDDRWTSDIKLSYNHTAANNRPINGKDRSSIYVLYSLPRSMDITDFKAGVNEFGGMLWYEGALSWSPNPYWQYQYDLNSDSRDRFMMSGSLKYKFTDWLEAEVRGGGDIYTTNLERKVYSGSYYANTFSNGKQTFKETNYSAMLSARKDDVFGKVGGAVMVGGNIMDRQWESLSGSTDGMVVPNLFSLGNSQNSANIGTGISHKKINSLYGTFEVSYDDWVYLDFTGRNDWSSTLSKANRSYFYPSVSLSYVVTDMLKSMGSTMPAWLDYVKLRGSYASVGNDMGPYNLYNGYIIGKDPVDVATANGESLLKDSTVVNELIKNIEFGAEMRFLSGKLGLDITWYKSNATNQLLPIPIDPMSGYSSMMINAGNIQNEGIEIMLDARIISNPNGLRWDLRANYSRNKNTIIDIAKAQGITSFDLGRWDDLYIRAENGSEYGDIYGTKFLRVDDESSPFYGELLLDGSGLPQRDAEIVKLGNQQADWLWGINNNFAYKNFELGFLFTGRMGGEIFSASNTGLQKTGTAAITAPGGERPDFVVDGVILDANNQPIKNTAAVSQEDYWFRVATLNNLGVGEAYLYDATNIRLRHVMLSYNLPKGTLGNVFQRAKVAVSCNNVWMIESHLHGIDPESVFATGTNAVGFESGAFPTMRSFQFSLTLGF